MNYILGNAVWLFFVQTTVAIAMFTGAWVLDRPYLKKDEHAIFGFQSQKGNILTLTYNSQTDVIIYRYGRPEKVELEIVSSKENRLFRYDHYTRGGLGNEGIDLNYLSFRNGHFEYKVYSEYYQPDNMLLVGIKLENLETGREYNIKGDARSVLGSLIDFRDKWADYVANGL